MLYFSKNFTERKSGKEAGGERREGGGEREGGSMRDGGRSEGGQERGREEDGREGEGHFPGTEGGRGCVSGFSVAEQLRRAELTENSVKTVKIISYSPTIYSGSSASNGLRWLRPAHKETEVKMPGILRAIIKN